MKNYYLFTSESVCEGHPDKICDQISDSILDEVLKQDKNGRVACETLTTRGLLFIAGEITTTGYVDIPELARNLLKEIGYIDPSYGFQYESVGIITSIQEQAPEIATGVDKGGAGDQGMMFGYATDETPELMPLPITLAHKLVMRLAEIRKKKIVDYLRPDGKSQVTVLYENEKPVSVESVVVSAQHNPGVSQKKIKDDIIELVINYVIPEELRSKKMKIFTNPTGSFIIGGPMADTGVTGRKIIVDTYGGVGSHGGGCFSGKDPTKVDRSGSYMARYLAKNIVASGIARKCEIQIAYVIGQVEPVSLMINTYGTGLIPDSEIVKIIKDNFDLSPRGIIKKLDLLRPIFRKTACYGHFGRNDEDFTWEKTDSKEIFTKNIR
ncbi:MAG TPA: methionine adenosyltransferase [bacterium]|nr:methionine adenosyltransferase [bacterium]HOM27719.1 methionine adenosyltransferase [bacterium]